MKTLTVRPDRRVHLDRSTPGGIGFTDLLYNFVGFGGSLVFRLAILPSIAARLDVVSSTSPMLDNVVAGFFIIEQVAESSLREVDG